MITLYANSYGVGFYVRYGNMAFSASSQKEADILNALPSTNEWLYYPDACGKNLSMHGIDSEIICHSGRICINGIYNEI